MRSLPALLVFGSLTLGLCACVNGRLDWAASGDGNGGGSGGEGDGETPSILEIVPNAGSRGLLVTITGENFTRGATVTIGGTACAPVAMVSSTQLTCRIGKRGSGVADVVVQNLGSSPATASEAFTYRSFLYVASAEHEGIGGFSIDDDTGALTPLSSSPSTQTDNNIDLVISPDGRFLFTISESGARIYSHEINPETGELGDPEIVGFPSVTINALAISPDSSFLLDASVPGNFGESYVIGASGGLTQAEGSPFFGLSSPIDLAISRDGKFAFYVGDTSGVLRLDVVSIDSVTGAPDVLSPGTGQAGTGKAVCTHPSRNFVYLTGGSDVAGFSYDDLGTLLHLGGAVETVSGGSVDCAVHPDGKSFYTLGTSEDAISQFSIDADGGLTSLGTPVIANGQIGRFIVSFGGKYLFVSDPNEDVVRVFGIDSSGVLSSELSPNPTVFQAGAMGIN